MGKKILALISCVFAMSFLLTGCGGKDDAGADSAKIVGTWVVDELSASGQTLTAEDAEKAGLDISFEFKADGTGVASAMGQKEDLTWKASGDSVDITVKGKTQTATLKDDRLVIENAEAEAQMKLKKK
ncbi:lipocalin family protein [Trueperella sp. LYQ143]|uniref:lipocalin family protein n=1 Tax=unclassified Trueperella TaxID=2630174 RepID=UPI003983B971